MHASDKNERKNTKTKQGDVIALIMSCDCLQTTFKDFQVFYHLITNATPLSGDTEENLTYTFNEFKVWGPLLVIRSLGKI